MKSELEHIEFINKRNPSIGFDIIQIEELLRRPEPGNPLDKLHVVGFYMLMCIEEGIGNHTIDFTAYPYQRGSILSIRKDQIHRFHFHEKTKGTILLFTNQFLSSYFEQLESQKAIQLFNEFLGDPVLHLQYPQAEEIFEAILQIKKEYFFTNDSFSLSIIRSQVHILINKLYRIKTKTGKTISSKKYLVEFIELQKLIEANIKSYKSVNYYAKQMGLSTKTLNNITQHIINKTSKEFIDEICIKQIKGLLINTKYSIKEIAYYMGFEEPTNFFKYFKRQTKTTPEGFRNLL